MAASKTKKFGLATDQPGETAGSHARPIPIVHVVSTQDPRKLGSAAGSQSGGVIVTRSTTSNNWMP